jgi:crotonobetainyl-CoA:carnitine CoA-transferase CaiB-like acyl-CoA transferase
MQESFFKGLRVVEFASVLAGPAVGMFFSELGATVVKIENRRTNGDMTRGWKLPIEDQSTPYSAYFFSVNWGKKHVFLDLDDPQDQLQAVQIAADADIVISNFKPSSAVRMGVDEAALRAINPQLIFAQLHAFADPEDESPAFDIVLQAEAGYLHMTGEVNGTPVRMPVAFIDTLAAHQLKEGILLALLHRERTGEGSTVSTSLMESALASLLNQAANYLNTGFIPQRMGAKHPNIAPYGDIFECADGKSIVLAVGTERQFERLCTVLNLPALITHPDFQSNASRVVNRVALIKILEKPILQYTCSDLMALFKQAGVPAAQIRDMEAVFEMPAAQNMILTDQIEQSNLSMIAAKRMKTNAFNIIHKKRI